jgi:succinate dehydrogenase/fumarate reductase cytochrome b subunit
MGSTRTRLQLLARRDAGSVLRAAVTMLAVVTTGGREHLVNGLRLAWNRRRLLSRDDAGYTTTSVIIVALVVVIALAAFVFLWMTVISKAIHTRVSCHPGNPCG